MKQVGFVGGDLISGGGTPQEMAAFYALVDAYGKLEGVPDLSLLTDRLYRRYVRLDDIDRAIASMSQVKKFFDKKHYIKDEDLFLSVNLYNLMKNVGQNVIQTLFSQYFSAFEKCASAARYSGNKIGARYRPLMTAVTDIPECFDSYMNRPLEEFDNLEGLPFWLR